MKPSEPPAPIADRLGDLVKSYEPFTMWRTARGFLLGVILLVVWSALIAYGLSTGHLWHLVAGGCGAFLMVALAVRGRTLGTRVSLFTEGMVVERRGQPRAIRWSEVESVRVEYRDYRSQPQDLCVVEVADGRRETFTSMSVQDTRDMLERLEVLSAPALAARMERALESGQVLAFGMLHLRASGWVVMNEGVPWRDLETIDHTADRLYACFSSVGLHEIGPYGDITSAPALLRLVVERARRDGGKPAIAAGLPVGRREDR